MLIISNFLPILVAHNTHLATLLKYFCNNMLLVSIFSIALTKGLNLAVVFFEFLE